MAFANTLRRLRESVPTRFRGVSENLVVINRSDLGELLADYDRLDAAYREQHALINSPELHDFAKGVVLEAAHQRKRWGTSHDGSKAPADWFWLVGYLAGKALHACAASNTEKALHHCISTAAALNNWHASLVGADTSMRPELPAESLPTGSGGEA